MNENELEETDLPQSGNSQFLKAKDIKGKVVPAKITNVSRTTFQNGEAGINLYVELGKEEKIIGLNKTRRKALNDAYGKKFADWVGKSIQLTTTVTAYQGSSFDSIVIIPSS